MDENGIRQPASPPIEDLAKPFFEMARSTFLKDGTHIPVALLFQRGTFLGPIALRFGNLVEKQAASRALASTVEEAGADAIVMVCEVWVGRAIPDAPLSPPSDQPGRKEALALIAENRHGESLYLAAEIVRTGGTVGLGGTTMTKTHTDWFFEPVRIRWRGLPS